MLRFIPAWLARRRKAASQAAVPSSDGEDPTTLPDPVFTIVNLPTADSPFPEGVDGSHLLELWLKTPGQRVFLLSYSGPSPPSSFFLDGAGRACLDGEQVLDTRNSRKIGCARPLRFSGNGNGTVHIIVLLFAPNK